MVLTELDTLRMFGNDSKERLEKALIHLQNGNGIILMDDEDRENEGDLVFSAHHMTNNQMALMIRKCSGIVCLCLPNEKADALELPYMVKENTSSYQTPFTVSIEAKEGVTTGVSAKDRLTTIKAASKENATSNDLAKPGHIFPLRAKDNGVLERKGHTEGSVDLMKLAGLKPEAVLCELMNDDGTMAKIDTILEFANEHNLIVLSIQDIIHYRKFVRDYK
ncbi:3,4-dihydroxy-2-butanone-4-phosphate synthase [Polaribacter sp. Z014]|uniref:3,4-dihydroxy-2-butanone 4-phosphate synthase n=1 Tax=Polaribacter sejongensis TaxID=985043 RepID=A0AAJ1QU86_9FLAO|nr:MULTISPECIES: 3,4-dihydroxy-2-butanone-4-phosphate synthase [Polaribacter]MCL7762209.1 3,4-dihydroxy-2-butanone-4-phosphate synthase [Polaribacter sp. Z014]MDN3618379.1 3,4-dihydroxy-2-butanone-4-phosphate synthase [Polaribacter undariae]QVY64365.1 3,4-dihydroxy-2-butanone-4-phosphate synthase [Polaribacter sp. Q13]UWD30637.1 3,4-dihydroxy-2-butanone-4-phosphate synthase [Polaribacter undariae]